MFRFNVGRNKVFVSGTGKTDSVKYYTFDFEKNALEPSYFDKIRKKTMRPVGYVAEIDSLFISEFVEL